MTVGLWLLLQTMSPNSGKGSPPAVVPRPKARPRLEPSISIQEKQGPLRDLFGPCSPNPPAAPAPPPPPALPVPLPEEPKTLPVESRGEDSVPSAKPLWVGGSTHDSLLGPMAEVILLWLRPAVWASRLRSLGFPILIQDRVEAPWILSGTKGLTFIGCCS